MKIKLPVIILFITGICTCGNLYAQDYSFTYYNAADGLLSSEIISLAKDEKGFLWIGTAAGLSKYDGYSFTNYQYAEDGHFAGIINKIKPAGANVIWIGASTGLYCIFNNKLIKISTEGSSPQGVNDMLPQADGSLWLATENGPALIDAKGIDITGNKKIILEKYVLPAWPDRNNSIDNRRATLISKAADGTIFIAQTRRLFQLKEKNIELIFAPTENNDEILSVFPISKNKVFFDAALSGMNKVENSKWTCIHFDSLYQKGKEGKQEGFWYAGTLGIFYFYPDIESASVFINIIDSDVLWPSGFLKDGQVCWLATHDGLIKLKPSVFNNYNDEKYNNVKEVYSFCQLQNGTFIAGTNRGRLWKKDKDVFNAYLSSAQTMVTRAEVKSLYEDERGWLWAGTGYQGIAVCRNGKIEQFTKEQSGLHDNTD